MKKIKFTCPHCASVLRVPGHLAGVSGPCPKCATTITAPSESDNSTIDVISVKDGTALASAIAGTGSATATLPPPVKPLQENRQRVVQTQSRVAEPVPAESNAIEAKIARSDYAPAPSALPPVPVESTPSPVLPSQYEIPLEPRQVSHGSYAEPIPHDAVEEKIIPVVSPPPLDEPELELEAAPQPEPMPQVVEDVAAQLPPPLEEEFFDAPPVLAETVPNDVVEPDVAASAAPFVEEPEVVLPGEPLVPELKEAPKIAIPKTQPIQIKKASTVMPPDRNEVEIEPTLPPGSPIDMPRLDVSLANGEIDPASDLQQFQQKEPTRIQLPQLDDEAGGIDSLDDFTVEPEPTPVEPVADIPEPNTEPIPLPPENNLDYAPPLPAVEIPMPSVETPAPFVPPDPTTAMALEQKLMQELSGTHPPVEEAPVDEMNTKASAASDPEVYDQGHSSPPERSPILEAPEERGSAIDPEPDWEPKPLIEQPDLHEPEETSQTNEGSMATMLGITEPEIEKGLSADLGLESVPRSEGKPAQEPARDRSMPVEEPAPAPLSPASQTDSELDVFDELLGRSAPGGKVGPSWIVLGAIVITVAVLAGVMLVVVWHSFGGGSKPLVEQDKELLDQKYSIISSGSSSENPAEKLEAVNSLDMSLPVEKTPGTEDKIAPPVVEKEAVDPPAINRDVKSSITLPGDGSKVMISDGGGNPVSSPPATPDARPGSEMPATLAGSDTIEPVAKEKDPGIESYNKKIGGEESSLTALDNRLAQMSDGVGNTIDDTPAIQDPPAEFKRTDTAVEQVQGQVGSFNGFPAPTADDPPLGKSREVIDAFIKAPDWRSRIPLVYHGESLRPAIEDYYKKWPFSRSDKFSVQLFQMEQDETLGGPYWVYLVSTSDADAGFPIIVRVENGKLKIDWEIYSEFQDKHFVRFRDGTIASPHSFRVVLEQKSDYFGKDRDDFKDRKDYLCFEVSPPYGSPGEFSQFAFVKKGTALATQLNKNIGLGEDLLAVVVTLDFKKFPHGQRHMIITKWITEGWFQ